MRLDEIVDLKWRKHPTHKGVLVRHGVGPEVEAEVQRQKRREQDAKREPRQSTRKAVSYNIDYHELGRKIEDAVGRACPDGDPIDYLIPYFRERGIEWDLTKHLDRAVQMSAHLRPYKTYDGYLKDMWDSYLQSDPEWNDGENPWT